MSPPALVGDVQVGQRAGPGEPRVDVDDRRAARLGLDDPLERDRMTLGHVGAADDDAVRVNQIARESGGAAAAEARPQTGNGGGVSYPGLVLDLDRAERGPELLDEVVLLVVERRAAEAGEAERPRRPAGPDASPASWPSWWRAPGRRSCPSPDPGPAAPSAVPYGRRYSTLVTRPGLGDQLLAGRALRAQPPARHRRVRVALDLGDGVACRRPSRRRPAGRSRPRSTGRPSRRRGRPPRCAARRPRYAATAPRSPRPSRSGPVTCRKTGQFSIRRAERDVGRHTPYQNGRSLRRASGVPA